MLFQKQKIKGLIVIKPESFVDKRGLFRRSYCLNELKLKKINFTIKQVNISENKNIQTLRGFHYQKYPFSEDKIITCIQGEIHNIVLDMRQKSKTYMKWQSFNLSEQNKLALLVPKGCANAYLTLKKKTWILYFHSQFYKPGYEKSIKYNDPKFNFDWPKKAKVISKKDNSIKFF
jgi:dTDP-4-dehydrorhamnose 3,5-epimerase